MEAWDDESVDVDRLLNRIITGVMHHPAQRDQGEDGARDCREIMIRSVEDWWNQKDDAEKDEFRRKLSREGVQNGENHKEGVHDTGHGCGKPLGMHKNFAEGGTFEDRIAGAAADAIVGGITGGISDAVQSQTGISLPGGSGSSGRQEESSEGGLGGFLNKVGGSILGGFKKNEEQAFSNRRDDDNSTTETRTEYGHSGGRYGQAEASRTEYSGGGESESYRRYEQDEDRRGNTTEYGYEERTETRPSHGGYEQRTERRWEENGNTYEQREESSWGGGRREERREEGGYGGGYGGERREEGGFGGGYGGGRRDDDFGGRREEGGFGGGYGGERRDEGGYGGGRRDEGGFGGGYGGERREEGGYGGGRRDDDFGGRRDDERRDDAGEFMDSAINMAGRFMGGDRRDDGERRGW